MFTLADNVGGYGCVCPCRYVLFICISTSVICVCVYVCVYLYVFYFTYKFVQKIVGRRDFFFKDMIHISTYVN